MSWTVTLSSAAATLVAVVFCGWRGAQPPNFRRGPRLFPYRLAMLLGCAIFMGLLVHMAHMAGLIPPASIY